MARIEINGLGIEYELLGEPGSPAVALTPGGRFSMETPGLKELGQALVQRGKRVLLWDRPNCGLSDISFDAESESALHGRTLATLIRELELGPTVIAGGSAGARVSLIAAAAAPELTSHLIIWWITGEPIGLMGLASFYCIDPAERIAIGGMAAVAEAPSWTEQVARNPQARATILSQDPRAFVARMQQWALAYRPSDTSPVPGMAPEDFAKLKMPVLILRSGPADVNHTLKTSERVHELIPASTFIDPPWGDDEWNERRRDLVAGRTKGLFVNWPKLAPMIADFSSGSDIKHRQPMEP